MLLLLWSCDRLSTSPEEERVRTYERIPGSDINQSLKSINSKAPSYSCSVVTLNKPGSENKFRHYSSIHFFSDEIVNQSREKTTTWSFIITTNPSSTIKSDWKHGDYENVVQTVTCHLPDVKGIEKEMISRFKESVSNDNNRLSTFEDSSDIRVEALRPKERSTVRKDEPSLMNDPLPEPDPLPGDDCGYYCSYFWIITNSVNGEIYSVTIECDSDAWVYECNVDDGVGDGLPSPPPTTPGGGGGGGSGGGGGDPGTPDAPHPCEYLLEPVPWMCGDEFDILIDPSFSNNSCLNSVFTNAGNAPTIDGYLNNFDGTFSVAHLRLAGNSNLPLGTNAITYEPENWVIKIDFNTSSQNLGQRPTLDVARTLIHELIHAEIYRKLLTLSDAGEIVWSKSFFHGMKDDFPGLFDYYMRWYFNKPNGVPSAQHQLMAEHYRDIIEDALIEFDNSHNDDVYEALAWIGLMGEGEVDQNTGLPPNPTVGWENLSQQDRLAIIAEYNGFRISNPSCQN